MANFAQIIITGGAVMDSARNLMLSDKPEKAYKTIIDCFGEVAAEAARQVLAGQANFVGDSRVGVRVESVEDPSYIRDLQYIYAGRVRLTRRWYRPCAMVTPYGSKDGPATIAWCLRLGQCYARAGEVVKSAIINNRITHVIFEPCKKMPTWMKPCTDIQNAVDDAIAKGRTLNQLETSNRPAFEADYIIRHKDLKGAEEYALVDLAQAAEDEAFEHQIAQIADQVRQQAGNDLFPLELLDGRVVQVPRAPFIHWALARLPNIRAEALPAWNLVSESGLKMPIDNPHHTDWVLGAGLTIEEGYQKNVTEPAWDKVADLQFAEVDRA